ncbi:MAG TPA: hypothetical protein VNS88_07255 [Nitrospiraceae bacterium]|nr:hypothetical protein [Nitrospiraceae bacterium]
MTQTEHKLWDMAHFKMRTSHFVNGLPVRVPIDPPYWRYYCTCGTVGGRASSEKAAFEAFIAHREKQNTSN